MILKAKIKNIEELFLSLNEYQFSGENKSIPIELEIDDIELEKLYSQMKEASTKYNQFRESFNSYDLNHVAKLTQRFKNKKL